MKFVSSKKSSKCVFCDIREGTDDVSNLIVWRGREVYVLMNRFPYTSGHLLVVANSHCCSLEQLTPACRAEMMELTIHSIAVLRKVYSPDGFNFGANIGAAAGAGIPDHAHLHVVPRWTGDAGFISILEEGCRRIRLAWQDLD
jgi:ATP adenylyltransferase